MALIQQHTKLTIH